MDELKKKDRLSAKVVDKKDKELLDVHDINGSRLTRLKAQQISTGLCTNIESSWKLTFFSLIYEFHFQALCCSN